MKSPFPGMDPYIEGCRLWEDFHHHLIGEIKLALAEATSEQYLIQTGERAYDMCIGSEDEATSLFFPDLIVRTTAPRIPSVSDNLAGEDEPVVQRAFIDQHHRETFVEISVTDPEPRLVTCIEVLSPLNKRRGTPGWELYQRKRQSLLLGAASLVEIDLLRGGEKLPMLDPWPNAPYTLLVCRQSRAPYCRVWPGHFQKPLPTIPVPLASPDPDVPLALQPMIEAIYARARYHRSIDYTRPLTPPLTDAEQTWFTEQLRARQPQT